LPDTLTGTHRLKNMIKSLLIAGAIAGAVTAPAMAGGLESNYVGAGAIIDPDGDTTGAFVSGRYNVPNIPVSLRPALSIGDKVDGGAAVGGGAAVTADFGIAENINLYGGGGVNFGAGTPINGPEDDTVGFAVVGIEAGIAEKVVVFTDLSFGLGGETTYIPKVGIGYRF
jgi:hypothetical protein